MTKRDSDSDNKLLLTDSDNGQNDGLNLSFVKDTYVDGKKLARNGRKTADSLLKDAVITVQFRICLSIPYSLVIYAECGLKFSEFLTES